MPTIDLSQKKPFDVRCANCKLVWTAAYLPMQMALAAIVLGNLHCPACGQDSTLIFKHEPEDA